MFDSLPIVAIVGRPNVGKSTLFNRLAGERRALVLDQPGMTRDRRVERIDLDGRLVWLVDTGGFYVDKADGTVERQMRAQAELAVAEADVVVLLLDVEEPDNPDDAHIVAQLRRAGKPVVAAVNKCDNASRKTAALEFYKLGPDRLIPISALHSHNISDLIEAIHSHLPAQSPTGRQGDPDAAEDDCIRIAIVGRPNVGKSTLVNSILGFERVIANAQPGTTRDPIGVPFERDGRRFLIIDTAGIRRRGRVERGAEMMSVFAALRSLEQAHVAVLLLDGTEGVTAQDQHVAGYVADAGRACIIAVNKWDLIAAERQIREVWTQEITRRLKFIPFAPWVAMSALTGQGVSALFPLIGSIYAEFHKRIETSDLNEWLQSVTARRPPSPYQGKALRMKYITQTGTAPPAFTIFLNHPQAVHFSYERYLKNQLYRRFGFTGCPVQLRFRKK
ncbi:MAG: ribosome biogenesis GTPase Der [Candidatus Sumerlaeia bacterium]